MKMLIAALMLAAAAPSFAQSAPSGSLSALVQWLGTQQEQLGTSLGFQKGANNKPVEYATGWWDFASLGSSGLNVGLASAQDYLDAGFGTAAANAETTRYGFFFPVHLGNLWNAASAHLPAKIGDHIYMASLPNVTLAIAAYEPTNGALDKWTIKKDGQLSIGYRFGGVTPNAAGALARP